MTKLACCCPSCRVGTPSLGHSYSPCRVGTPGALRETRQSGMEVAGPHPFEAITVEFRSIRWKSGIFHSARTLRNSEKSRKNECRCFPKLTVTRDKRIDGNSTVRLCPCNVGADPLANTDGINPFCVSLSLTMLSFSFSPHRESQKNLIGVGCAAGRQLHSQPQSGTVRIGT